MRLQDQVTLVTGGGRGIGKAIALKYAAEGAKVAISGRTAADLEATVEEINAQGGEALGVAGDVALEDDVAQMVQATVERFGKLDVLVNNAATNLTNIPITDLTLEQWERVIAVNLTGAFLCTRAALPIMYQQRHGAIINISSIGGRRGSAGRGPYRATKAGLLSLTETTAAEAYQFGVRVNAICPGSVATDMIRMLAGVNAPDRETWIKPEEIANLAVFLASDESSSIVGAVIDAFGASSPLFR